MNNHSPTAPRKHDRTPVKVPVTIRPVKRTNQAFEGEMQNLSEGGAFIASTAPVETGEQITIEVMFTKTESLLSRVTNKELVELSNVAISDITKETVVRWKQENGKEGFGVEFVGASSQQRDFIKAMLAYFEQLIKAGVSF